MTEADHQYDGPYPAVDFTRACHSLESMGFKTEPGFAGEPTYLRVYTRDGQGVVLLALDFNVSGWEAAYASLDEADQQPLHTFLSGWAGTDQFILWAAALAIEPESCLDSKANQEV